MTHKTYTLSLSRWHTAAKRLSAHGEGLFESATAALGGSTVQHELSEAQKAALFERGQKALADLDQARSAIRAAAVVRAALATANSRHGVSEKLALAEGVRRELQLLDHLGHIDLLARVELDQANVALSKRAGADDMLGGRRGGLLPVSLVAINALDAHRRDQAILERQQQELMDEVNDLNRNTLSIDLPEDVAVHAGL